MECHHLDAILEALPVGVLDAEGNLLSMSQILTYEKKEALYKLMQNPGEWESVRSDAVMKRAKELILELVKNDVERGGEQLQVENAWKEVLRVVGVGIKVRQLLHEGINKK